MKPYNYSKLGDDGFVPVNTFVDTGDIIIGKCMGIRDSSVVVKGAERGFVDRNCCNDNFFVNTNGDGYTFAKVRIRGDRHPTIGDKFCLTPDHDVMTSTGWIPIYKVTRDMFVAQLSLDDGLVEYVRPTGILRFANSDSLISVVDESGVELLTCTPEHKLYCKPAGGLGSESWGLVKAQDLLAESFDSLSSSQGLGTTIADEINCGVHWIDSSPRLRVLLVAHFIYNGSLDYERRTCNIDGGDFADEIVAMSRGYIYSSGNGRISSRDDDLFTLLDKVSATPGMPFFLFAEQNPTLIRTAVKIIAGRRTMSVCLAESLQQLALHALRTTVDVTLNDDDHEESGVSFEDSAHLSTHLVPSSEKSSVVYCIEVPSHVFYVRKKSRGVKSRGVWTGNSSRHGQKGTVGIIYRQEDMPFSRDGIVPDIIINPHAIPSRMTVAQLMECIMSKSCTSIGSFGNATPFTGIKVIDLADLLVEHGMERHSNEILYNSRTGEQLATTVFIGPTFYQRLKHMVDDKIHSRAASGPVVMMTRQPAEGRARDGGLRLGEMEIECNWAHGTMNFLKERFMECSDNYRVHICRRCGMMATANPEKNIYNCKACKNINNFAEIRIPYACKLFFQEVQAMNIGARFLLNRSQNGFKS